MFSVSLFEHISVFYETKEIVSNRNAWKSQQNNCAVSLKHSDTNGSNSVFWRFKLPNGGHGNAKLDKNVILKHLFPKII